MKILNGKGKGYKKGTKCSSSKRLNLRMIASKRDEISSLTMDPYENSNDSGLGFDHIEPNKYSDPEYCWANEETKKRKHDVKLESDNANDNFTFSSSKISSRQTQNLPLSLRTKGNISGGKGKGNRMMIAGSQGTTRGGKVQLQIIAQPESQHRARYQTEGSRGAVKDSEGHGFPVVKLCGYNKPATLEVFIGTDVGRVTPHMFYQACKVSGKNSTPCCEKKVDGTVLIEIELDPSKEMTAICDCVGILKERNVDVEHRFPEESTGRSKKKSTRCRMVFRTTITHDDNSVETIQATSQPIVCTQPPGIPEISKKSLSACPANGGLELFILGKNFLKDTQVCFTLGEPGSDIFWKAIVQPDKEFLQQAHLVCNIPPFRDENITSIVAVKLIITAGKKASDPHTFLYTPVNVLQMGTAVNNPTPTQSIIPNAVYPAENVLVGVPWHVPMQPGTSFLTDPSKNEEKNESSIMPPPTTVALVRRNPTTMVTSEVKLEAESPPDLTAALQHFVGASDSPLPPLSVENYLSRLEGPSPVQITTSTNQKLIGGEKPDQLIPLALPQLSMTTQPVESMDSTTQMIMDSKITRLLGAEGGPILSTSGLMYTEAAPPLTSPPVPPVLIEGSTPVQEFMVSQQSSVSQTPGYNVGSVVLERHNNPLIFPPETITPSSSTSLQQPFTPILPDSVPSFSSPSKKVDKIVKPEYQNSLLQNIVVEGNPKPATVNLIPKKCDEGIPLPHELTQMSENDLISYINPSCFDQGNPSTFSQFFI